MKIIRVERSSWHDYFRKIFPASFDPALWCDADEYDYALACFGEGNHFLSYATIKETGKRSAFICFFAVHPAYLKQGFGFASIDHMIERLRGYYDDVRCFVENDNKGSERICQKMKFEKLRDYNIGPRVGVEYAKRLEV